LNDELDIALTDAQESHRTMPIPQGNETVVINSAGSIFTSRNSFDTRRPTDGALALWSLLAVVVTLMLIGLVCGLWVVL
jgi:hypothetical protein